MRLGTIFQLAINFDHLPTHYTMFYFFFVQWSGLIYFNKSNWEIRKRKEIKIIFFFGTNFRKCVSYQFMNKCKRELFSINNLFRTTAFSLCNEFASFWWDFFANDRKNILDFIIKNQFKTVFCSFVFFIRQECQQVFSNGEIMNENPF